MTWKKTAGGCWKEGQEGYRGYRRNNAGGGVMKIVVQRNKRGKWFWKLVAANGRILAVSEDYTRKGSCYDTVHRLGVAKVEEKKS